MNHSLNSVEKEKTTGDFSIVPDLSAWMPEKKLLELIVTLGQTLEAARFNFSVAMAEWDRDRLRKLIALVVFSCAVGIYSFDKLKRRLQSGGHPQSFWKEIDCDPGLVQSFRQANRELIEECLGKACLLVWKMKFGNWQTKSFSQASCRKTGFFYRVNPALYAHIASEVKRRLNEAEQSVNST